MRFFSEDDVAELIALKQVADYPQDVIKEGERLGMVEPLEVELGTVDHKAFLVWWLSEKTPWEEHKRELVELAFHVAGAATVPLLEDHPDYVFPAERVKEAVRTVLAERGIDRLPEGYRTQRRPMAPLEHHHEDEDEDTHRRLRREMQQLHERMDRLEASAASQQDVQALTDELGTVEVALQTATTNLTNGIATVQQELDTIAAANPGIDLTPAKNAADALQGEASAIGDAASKVGTLKPTPPAPPPAPAKPTKSVYTFSGDPATIDGAQWSDSGFVTDDGAPPQKLYYFAGDTAPGDAKGDGLGGVWHLFGGAVKPAA